ncbi:MAG: hypothetical protein AB8B97_20570 [Granulosicoccus sp.]
MQEIKRVGMLTPSSNTVLEPSTSRLLHVYDGEVSMHVSRLPVVEISLNQQSKQQFSLEPFLQAAERLAEAQVHLIVWNGTSASWLGIERDRELSKAIETRFGIQATTTLLAYEQALLALNAQRLILITPYLHDIQIRIIEQLTQTGYVVAAERHLNDAGNFSFSNYPPELIHSMIVDAIDETVRNDSLGLPLQPASNRTVDAVLILCTNFNGASVAQDIEKKYNIPVIDSVAVTAWYSLHCVGINSDKVAGWGQVFSLAVPNK